MKDEVLIEKLDGLRDQISTFTESFHAQLRSLTATVNSNTTEFEKRVTMLESHDEEHQRRIDQQQAESMEMAKQLGGVLTLVTQIRGANNFIKYAGGGVVGLVGIWQAWVHWVKR